MSHEEYHRRSEDGLLNEVRQDIKKLLESNAEKTQILKSIEDQTKKTNGRVTSLEISHSDLEKKHDKIVNRVIGWAAGVSFCISLIYKVIFK